LPWVKRHPEIKIISISEAGKDFLEKELGRDDIIFIPENHCNYERQVKPRGDIKMVGVIGGPNAFQFDHEEFTNIMASHGLGFVHFKDYDNRQDVIDFYNKIDIQVVWRQWLNFPQLNNPLKLINAMSFGIPTVGFPEIAYKTELSEYFLHAKTVDEMVKHIVELKNNASLYNTMANEGIAKADDYHIDNIAKLYRALAEDTVLEFKPAKKVIISSSPVPEIVKAPVVEPESVKTQMRGQLLIKDITLTDNGDGLPRKVPVYGLAHFRTSPRRMGLGTQALRTFEKMAERDNKHCIVCFTGNGSVEFYKKAGWHVLGTYKDQYIISSKQLQGFIPTEVW